MPVWLVDYISSVAQGILLLHQTFKNAPLCSEATIDDDYVPVLLS